MSTKAKLFWDLNFPKQPPAAGACCAAGAVAAAAGAGNGGGVETHVPRAKFLSAFWKAFASRGFPYEVCERVVDIVMLGGSGSAYVDVAHFAEFLTLAGGHFDTCMEVLANSLIERNGHVARWFHGLMERDPAVAAIAAKPNSYLVRLSHNAAAKGQYHLLTHTKQPASDPNAKSVFIQLPITPRNGVYWATTTAGGQQRSFPSLMTILAEVCKDLQPVSSTFFRHHYSEAAERKFAAEALIPYTQAPRPLVSVSAAHQPGVGVPLVTNSFASASGAAAATAPGTLPVAAAASSVSVRRSSGSGTALAAAGGGGGGGAVPSHPSPVVSPNVRRMSGSAAAGAGPAAALASALLAVDLNAGPVVSAASAAAAAGAKHPPPSHYTESFSAGAKAGVVSPVALGSGSPSAAAYAAASASVPSSPTTPPVVWTELESAAYHAGVSLSRIVPITRLTLATPFVGADGGPPGRYELWKAVYGGRGVVVKLYNDGDKHKALWLRELALLSRPALFDPHVTVLEAVVPHPLPALCLVLACPSHEAHHTAADLRLLEALTKPPVAVGAGAAGVGGVVPGAVMSITRVAWLDNVLHRTQVALDLLEALVVCHTPHSTATARQLHANTAGGDKTTVTVMKNTDGPTPPGAPDAKSEAPATPARMGVVVHGDITPANCLLNSSHRLQLTGFAFARTLPVDAAAGDAKVAAVAAGDEADQPGASPQHRAVRPPQSPVMSGRALPPPAASAAALAALAALDEPNTTESADNERYCAPEVLRLGAYSPACDVWSFGIILWQLWRGPQLQPEPFAGLSAEAAVQTILSSKGALAALDVPMSWPEPIRRILTSCWQPKPESRATSAQLLGALREYMRSIPIVKTPYTSFHADALHDLVFSA